MEKENYKGISGKYKWVNEKLRNAELVGAGVLAMFGQFGWAGVLAVGAAIDHAQVKLAEWWQKKKPVLMSPGKWHTLPKGA